VKVKSVGGRGGGIRGANKPLGLGWKEECAVELRVVNGSRCLEGIQAMGGRRVTGMGGMEMGESWCQKHKGREGGGTSNIGE